MRTNELFQADLAPLPGALPTVFKHPITGVYLSPDSQVEAVMPNGVSVVLVTLKEDVALGMYYSK